ncbi:hypothetical protein LG634_07275 [Streptomyces bambusae]|uniref:hypothetical protein n=1 Tax=Streptomyces bambusae TaxID=1550616 RepID=UPI001CFD66FE|nr:hypothetical protein [Streptomyces bambusae]MCB5164633.1 hypothetical protein [Streptomyces bambusae]
MDRSDIRPRTVTGTDSESDVPPLFCRALLAAGDGGRRVPGIAAPYPAEVPDGVTAR